MRHSSRLERYAKLHHRSYRFRTTDPQVAIINQDLQDSWEIVRQPEGPITGRLRGRLQRLCRQKPLTQRIRVNPERTGDGSTGAVLKLFKFDLEKESRTLPLQKIRP